MRTFACLSLKRSFSDVHWTNPRRAQAFPGLPSVFEQGIAAAEAPLPLVAFGTRLLVSRLLLGFGMLKFGAAGPGDHWYIRHFMIAQPMVSPAGLAAHAVMPAWVWRVALLGSECAPEGRSDWLGHTKTFLSPAPHNSVCRGDPAPPCCDTCPCKLGLCACRIRRRNGRAHGWHVRVWEWAVGSQAYLALACSHSYLHHPLPTPLTASTPSQLTGNFGFFNLLTALLALSHLDHSASVFGAPSESQRGGRMHLLTSAAAALVFAPIMLASLPFNSWVNLAWTHWPGWRILRPVALFDSYISFLRSLSQLRLVASYGVFPPNAFPGQRWVVQYEVRVADAKAVEALGPADLPLVAVASTPPRASWLFVRTRFFDRARVFVAPYHPRVDHGLFYESMGLTSYSPGERVPAGA